MAVESKHAEIDTLHVTLQALRVDKKQMTLAVFRQLPAAQLHKEDGELAFDSLWGWVKYDIAGEGSMWFVTETGGRLYRCPNFRIDSLEDLRYRARRLEKEHKWWHSVNELPEKERTNKRYEERAHYRSYYWNAADGPEIEKDLIEIYKKIERSINMAKNRQRLRSLPQLFIAV